MKNPLKRGLFATALVCLFLSCSAEQVIQPQDSNYEIDLSLSLQTDWEVANEILVLMNEHRVTHGFTEIAKSEAHASAYATDHTMYMINMNAVNHDHYFYRSGALVEMGANVVGEAVAFGYTNAEDVVTAWLNSPPHKDVIEGDYTHVGFGVLQNDDGHYFFTTLFYQM